MKFVKHERNDFWPLVSQRAISPKDYDAAMKLSEDYQDFLFIESENYRLDPMIENQEIMQWIRGSEE